MSIAGRREERVGLEDLVVKEESESKARLEFNVEEIMTPERVQAYIGYYEEKCNEGDWSMVAHTAKDIKILFPDLVGELDLENKWVNIKRRYQDRQAREDWSGAISQAECLKILFPDKMSELNLEDSWENFKTWYEELCSGDDWGVALDTARKLMILFPDRVEDLRLEDKREQMENAYKKKYDKGSWWEAARNAASFKILFSDSSMVGSEFEIMKAEFNNACRDGRWMAAGIYAPNLKIIAAKEVKVTDQGLEFVMSSEESFEKRVEERPQRIEM